MAEQLPHIESGDVDYLLVVLPDAGNTGEDRAVAKGAITYVEVPGSGVLTQLSVVDEMRSHGFGSLLVRSMEHRIRDRGSGRAEIAVELDNPRARRLDERLGFVAYDERPASWMQTGPDGQRYRYHTICTWLAETLTEHGDH